MVRMRPKTTAAAVSRWSLHDPVLQAQGASDHWAKMRVKLGSSETIHVLPPISYTTPRLHRSKSAYSVMQYRPQMTQYHAPQHKAAGRSTCPQAWGAERRPQRSQQQQLQGSLQLSSPRRQSGAANRTGQPRHSVLRTELNEKARQGHVYWYRQRPKKPLFSQYSAGAYKTSLGLAFAPRS